MTSGRSLLSSRPAANPALSGRATSASAMIRDLKVPKVEAEGEGEEGDDDVDDVDDVDERGMPRTVHSCSTSSQCKPVI